MLTLKYNNLKVEKGYSLKTLQSVEHVVMQLSN